MKQIYTLLTLTIFSFSLNSQVVEEKQTPLVVKKTATWCNPCGTWGWDLFNEIWDEVLSDAVILEMHDSGSSGLYSPDALSFYGLHESRSSTPVFYTNTINETAYSGGGIYPSITKDNIIAAVDSTNAQAPIVNSGFTQSISGNTLTVDTKVKYFQNTDGDYYLGVYLTEDNVEANQSGITGTATHKRIMRASIHPNIEGTLISTGPVTAGTEFSDSHTFTLDQNWNSDFVKVFTVIWEKVGTEFQYVNAHQTEGFASVNELAEKEEIDAKLYPNVAAGDEDVTLEINNSSKQNVLIEVYDQVGKKINTIYNGDLTKEHYTFNVNPSKSLNKGLYFVSITSDKNTRKTIKMVVGK